MSRIDKIYHLFQRLAGGDTGQRHIRERDLQRTFGLEGVELGEGLARFELFKGLFFIIDNKIRIGACHDLGGVVAGRNRRAVGADRKDIDAVGVAHQDIAKAAARELVQLLTVDIKIADGVEGAGFVHILDLALLLVQILHELVIGFLAGGAALFGAGERLADGLIIRLDLGGRFGLLKLDHLNALAFELFLGVLVDFVVAENEVGFHLDDLVDVGILLGAHDRCGLQLRLGDSLASAGKFSFKIHIRHNIGGDRVENDHVFGFFFDRVVGNAHRIFLLLTAGHHQSGRQRHGCRQQNGNQFLHHILQFSLIVAYSVILYCTLFLRNSQQRICRIFPKNSTFFGVYNRHIALGEI